MSNTAKWVCDTNILLDYIELLNDYKVILLSHTLKELEKHKTSTRGDLSYKARKAVRYIKHNRNKFIFDTKNYNGSELGRDFTNEYEDDNILQACKMNGYGLITGDILLQFKAEGLGIEVIDLENELDEKANYSGVKDIYISSSKEDQETLANIYEHPELNQFNLVRNQYLYIWNKAKPTVNSNGVFNGYEFIDAFRFNGDKLVKLKFKPIFSRYIGEKVRPINKKQCMLFDLLQNNKITIKSCFGNFGAGKDYIMLSHALHLIEQGKMDKIIWARNNVELEDVPALGILPGDKNDKLIEFAMPLADHVGGIEGLKMLIAENKLEIQHLGSLRGRDIKNSIIYVTECQNHTDKHFELMIGRVGKGSQLWLNGDLKQTDSDVYRNKSGIKALSNLKGEELFGMVTLDKTERSETAKLAEKLMGNRTD